MKKTGNRISKKRSSACGPRPSAPDDKYRVLVESTDTAYMILDGGGRVLEANKEYLRLTGRGSLKAVIGHKTAEWTAPYDRKRCSFERKKCLRRGYVRGLCIDYVSPGGQATSVEINAKALKAGRSYRILALCRDITGYRNIERALRESEERYRVLVEGTNDVIYSATPNGVLNYISPAISGYGWSPGDLTGKSILSAVALEDRARLTEEFRRSINHGSEFVSEFRCVTKTGKIVWFSDCGKVQRDAKGRVTGIKGVLIDITERKRAEEALREREALLEAIFDTSPDFIFLKDMQGRYVKINKGALRILGLPQERVIGRTDAEVFGPELAEKNEAEDMMVMRSGRTMSFLKEMKVRSETYQMNVIKTPFSMGEKQGMLGVGRDVTRLKKMEGELALARAAESADRIARPLAHDFNNALNIINGYASLLGELEAGDPGKEEAVRIIKAVKRAAKITDKLRSFAATLSSSVK